jgi:hypothetical protein
MMQLHGHLSARVGAYELRATYAPGHGWRVRVSDYLSNRALWSANTFERPEDAEAAGLRWIKAQPTKDKR